MHTLETIDQHKTIRKAVLTNFLKTSVSSTLCLVNSLYYSKFNTNQPQRTIYYQFETLLQQYKSAFRTLKQIQF